MKHLKKFENLVEVKQDTKNPETLNEVLDSFSNRIESVNLDDKLTLKIERENTFYRISINKNDLELGTIDIQPMILRTGSYFAENNKVSAEVKNLHVNEEFRNQHLGSTLIQKAIDAFGDLNLYIYPNPNRIKDLNENNIDNYRESLIKLYTRYGFEKIKDDGFGMKRLPDN